MSKARLVELKPKSSRFKKEALPTVPSATIQDLSSLATVLSKIAKPIVTVDKLNPNPFPVASTPKLARALLVEILHISVVSVEVSLRVIL